MKNKILKSCMALMLMVSSISTVKAYSYQSKPGVEFERDYHNNVVKNIRYMETAEGTMGLNAEFDEATWPYVNETTSANNIDIHLAKNTEYAAIVMLAKSNYGVKGKDISNSYDNTSYTYPLEASTTHNMTGVFGINYWEEHVAAGVEVKVFTSQKNRYSDKYAESSSAVFDETNYIIGDGTYELRTFSDHSRGYPPKGYYLGRTEMYGTHKSNSVYSASKYMRAVVWCGQGL